ncbi:MAG: IS110 family transposase [Caldisericia bacterium]
MHDVFVVIDISKNFFNVYIVNRRGEEIKRGKFNMDSYGFNKLIEELNEFIKRSIIIGMESSGVYHMTLYSFLKEKRVDIEKIVIVTFPEIIKFYNIFSISILNLIKDYPSSKKIRELSDEKIEEIINKNRRGRKSSVSSKRIIELAKNSIGISSEIKNRVLSFKISHLFFLMDKEREIEEIIKRNIDEVMRKNVEIITSIKGIGEVSAIHLLSEICDINRFSSYKKLIFYSGFDPTIYQSGNFEGKSRISKRGNRHIRRVVWIMANSVIIYNEVFRSCFIKKIEKGIPYKKAIISIYHKLIRVIYSLINDGSYFDSSPHLIHNSL